MKKFISILLVFLLLASVSIPTASAHAAPAVGLAAAAPETAEIVIAGITVVMSGIAALKIAENLGKTWDNTMKGWDQLMKEMGRGKNIMTVDKNLASDLINRFNGKALENAVRFEKHPRGKLGKEDFYKHANFEAKNQRCHVWVREP